LHAVLLRRCGVVAGFIMTRYGIAVATRNNSLSSTLQNLTSQFSGLSASLAQEWFGQRSSARTMLESPLWQGNSLRDSN
jgi:hypothetical protein